MEYKRKSTEFIEDMKFARQISICNKIDKMIKKAILFGVMLGCVIVGLSFVFYYLSI